MPVNPLSNMAKARVAAMKASEKTGVDFDLLMATAKRESAFNPKAKASSSTAAGMFQFVEGTWLGLVRKHGPEHGLAKEAKAISLDARGRPTIADPAMLKKVLDLRYEPEISAKMAGELALTNASYLEAKLQRPVTNAEVYAAHVFGPRGAELLIKAAESGSLDKASSLLPSAAAANPRLFREPAGRARTPAEVLTAVRPEVLDTGSTQLAEWHEPAQVQARIDPNLTPIAAPEADRLGMLLQLQGIAMALPMIAGSSRLADLDVLPESPEDLQLASLR